MYSRGNTEIKLTDQTPTHKLVTLEFVWPNTFSIFSFSPLCLDLTKLLLCKFYFCRTESYIIEGDFALCFMLLSVFLVARKVTIFE